MAGSSPGRSEAAARQAFAALHEIGLGVVDVGSRGGLHRVFDEVAPLLRVVGFDVDAEECRRLNARPAGRLRSVVYVPCGLGRADGDRPLHVTRNDGCSSLYRPSAAFLDRFPGRARYDVMAIRTVPVRSLDALVGDRAVPLPAPVDFLKIDAQGAELDVLLGARKTLCDQVVAVEVEVEFARLYAGQPLFRDVDALLSECGFALFKLRRHHWVRKTFEARPGRTAGQLVFGEALYLRDPLDAERPWHPAGRRQAEALLLLATLYDLYDFAWELTAGDEMAGLVDATSVRRYIEARSGALDRPWNLRRLARAWWHRRRLEHWLSWRDRFTSYSPRWGRADNDFYTRR